MRQSTAALVVLQGGYFALGYLVAVVLARELGPAAYGVYALVMSVLVFIEQAARRAVPVAATRLAAAEPATAAEVARVSIVLNLLLHLLLLALFWIAAPYLSALFHIENGARLFRLAALDLPFYGIYTALQGAHQARRNFFRLGFSDVVYAGSKLLGVSALVWLGMSVELALLVNIAVSVIGVIFLSARFIFRGRTAWISWARRILDVARHVAVYSIAAIVLSCFDLWLLDAELPFEAATVGIYAAALNIARVPGFVLSAVSQVLLPAISRAFALHDYALIRHYIRQAARLFLMLFVPAAMVLCVLPEHLMEWVYSERYAGGGPVMAVLTLAHGLWGLHAILSATLVAVGRGRALGWISLITLLIGFPLLKNLIQIMGAPGAALGSVILAAISVVSGAVVLWRQVGPLVRRENMSRIAAAAMFMLAVTLLLGGFIEMHPLMTAGGGLIAYTLALILLSELKAADLAAMLSRARER